MSFLLSPAIPDFIVGCRDPATPKGIGHGAFVGGSHKNMLIYARFHEGSDYIGFPKTTPQIHREYNRLLDRGWMPMSAQDIFQTAGIK